MTGELRSLSRIANETEVDASIPTRWSSLVFSAKAVAHRLRRRLQNFGAGAPRRLLRISGPVDGEIVAESRTRLWSDGRPEERHLQLGKVHNLRRAVASIDRAIVPEGRVFSFWHQVGRPSRRRGFATGRMLQQGCLVPSVGGGLCQLSNALYDAALQAGCEIVERHPHSRVVPGSAAVAGRDATVAWNYVDLRFRAAHPLRIEARLTGEELIVRFHGTRSAQRSDTARAAPPPVPSARSCDTCGEISCFRHEGNAPRAGDGRTAYLVDENWPEFQDYVARNHQPEDVFGQPIDGRRWHLPRYAWPGVEFAKTGAAPVATLRRMVALRRAPPQGPARRNAELAGAARIARRLGRLLSADIGKVCVAQSLLPQLWLDGHLGGREVEVLMTRLPIGELQRRLDQAFAAHPDRATLADFRAPPELVEAEAAALAHAARIVTPHHEIARLFGEKAMLLDWRRPLVLAAAANPPQPTRRIAFPGPTIARKGAYAVREAAMTLGLEVVALGSELEGAGFWHDVSVRKVAPGTHWLDGVGAVVQPAIVEERPRALLQAIAAGVPVIATPGCGLAEQPGVTVVAPDDAAALIGALRLVLGDAPTAVADEAQP